MKTEDILKNLSRYQDDLFIDANTQAGASILASRIILIRGQMIHLVDKVAEAEKEYKFEEAKLFDKLIQEGIKKSPAIDAVKMNPDLASKKIEVERLRNYLKYIDGLCTSVQTVIKFETSTNL